ncbi:uncharacterized protein EDB91DRAFT_1248004 [Suillus paluster]|uniref:uncharacterized protein n=1 Tax=Suillus paluster TaxID=48578 RepID=UPI001B872040|nr:uncharacterized protein EDB91DRAFT_1248004 [Suillus paluster]KAG1741450.1 hypothetical protein EDB91DRAFT_1248004 [Suillus paluster]
MSESMCCSFDCNLLARHNLALIDQHQATYKSAHVKAFTLGCSFPTIIEFPGLLATVSALRAQNAAEVEAYLQRLHRLFISIRHKSNYRLPSLVIRLAEMESALDTNAFCNQGGNACWNPNWHLVFHYAVPQWGRVTPDDVASICKVLWLDSVTDATVQSSAGELWFRQKLIGQMMSALRSLSIRDSTLAVGTPFEELKFKQRRKHAWWRGDITDLTKTFEQRGRMGLNLPSLKLVRCVSERGDALESLKQAAIRMGVNYTDSDGF